MSALPIPAPGTKHGPCAEPCQHKDCALTRFMAASFCVKCSKAIGYDRPFYKLDEEMAHAECAENAVEQERMFSLDAILAAHYATSTSIDKAVRHAVAEVDVIVGKRKRFTVPKGEMVCRPLGHKLAGSTGLSNEVTCLACVRLMATATEVRHG